MDWLKLAPWIIIILLAGYIGWDKYYNEDKVAELTQALTVAQNNDATDKTNYKMCQTSLTSQNAAVLRLQSQSEQAQRDLSDATQKIKDTKTYYEERIAGITTEPVATTCDGAMKKLRTNARGHSVWPD